MQRCALPSGGGTGDGICQLRERRVQERAWNTDATVQGCRSCSLADPREMLLTSTVLYTERERTAWSVGKIQLQSALNVTEALPTQH